MVEHVRIISEKSNLKKPQKKNEKNIFAIYSTKKEMIKKADTLSIDTELSIKYQKMQQLFS